jgi:hypothetical protein
MFERLEPLGSETWHMNGGHRHPETNRNLVHRKICCTFIYPYVHISPVKMGKIHLRKPRLPSILPIHLSVWQRTLTSNLWLVIHLRLAWKQRWGMYWRRRMHSPWPDQDMPPGGGPITLYPGGTTNDEVPDFSSAATCSYWTKLIEAMARSTLDCTAPKSPTNLSTLISIDCRCSDNLGIESNKPLLCLLHLVS